MQMYSGVYHSYHYQVQSGTKVRNREWSDTQCKITSVSGQARVKVLRKHFHT